MGKTTTWLSILASTALGMGCATPTAAVAPAARIEVQLPARQAAREDFVGEWSPPLPRPLRLRGARVGEVVVAGSWTVHFQLQPEDAAWLDELRRQHHHTRVSWQGHELLCSGDSGYVLDLGSKQRAEQALHELWPAAAAPGGAAEAPTTNGATAEGITADGITAEGVMTTAR